MRLLAGYIKFIVIFGHVSVYKATHVGYKVVSLLEGTVDLIALFLILALLIFAARKFESVIPVEFWDKSARTFIDNGDTVLVRPNSYSRFYKASGKLVTKSDIKKVQKAGCVSLFTSSNNVIDITMHPSNRDSVFDSAKRLFKDAKVVEIDIEG
ncbi:MULTISPECIES: hypothetical protein [Pseudoalteromonas]|jgi:hypothetical protein|uniref:hypothetical protein n=1 Tax=Pseudoalteromonas TaxID=53246 RepID=UPI0023F32E00|nr:MULTISPECIES: hypothetical protein [Pseudoalteromonas]